MRELNLNQVDSRNFYYLKNKNKDLIRFEWDTISSSLTVPTNVVILDSNTPSFIKDRFASWLGSRTPPKHRAFMKELLETMNLHSTKDVLDFSRGLSLTDTFWVTNDQSLTWDEVSLYSNEFDETISKIAFEGLHGLHIKTTSPEFSTDGNLPKCWVRESDGVIYLKKGRTSGAANYGNEPYSEYMASQLLDVLGYDHVRYTLEHFRGSLVSSCPLFTTDRLMMVPIYQMVSVGDIFDVIHFAEEHNIAVPLYQMFIFDYLILNSDRHGANFAVMLDADTYQIQRLAPIYDNGYGLLAYYLMGDNLDSYINQYKPALYDSYEDLARYAKTNLKTSHNVERLINFKFNRDDLMDFPRDRLSLIEDFLRTRVHTFLSW